MRVNPLDPGDLAALPWSLPLDVLSFLASADKARLQQASLAWNSQALARPLGVVGIEGF